MRTARISLAASLGLCLAMLLPTGPTAWAETVRDRLWIWGHPAGAYNASFLSAWPRKSTIEPVAAAQWMGTPNIIFVHYDGQPAPPLDAYYAPFAVLDRVYWSLVGVSGATSSDEREMVYQLAEAHENITGFILDDFFHESAVTGDAPPNAPWLAENDVPFRASLTAEQLHDLGQRRVRSRRLPIMAVLYTGQISPRAKGHLDEVDEVCLWTWRPEDLKDLEANLTSLETLVPGKPIYLGCYTYDFHASQPLPVQLMQEQTETGYAWLKSGRIQGLIFLATPNVDVGLEAVEWTRQWIERVGDSPLPARPDVELRR